MSEEEGDNFIEFKAGDIPDIKVGNIPFVHIFTCMQKFQGTTGKN